jgi:hypothetical protein
VRVVVVPADSTVPVPPWFHRPEIALQSASLDPDSGWSDLSAPPCSCPVCWCSPSCPSIDPHAHYYPQPVSPHTFAPPTLFPDRTEAIATTPKDKGSSNAVTHQRRLVITSAPFSSARVVHLLHSRAICPATTSSGTFLRRTH